MKKGISIFLLVCLLSGATASANVLIQKGDYNENVITLHQKLASLGLFNLRAESPYGPKTEEAVKLIQSELGLEQTGVIGSQADLDQILALDHIDAMLGWVQDESGWKYYEGTAVSNTWKKIDNIWYRFDEDGYRLSSKWFWNGDAWYWMKEDGKMAASEWLKYGDYWYYLKENGKMASEEYIGQYWIDADGHWVE